MRESETDNSETKTSSAKFAEEAIQVEGFPFGSSNEALDQSRSQLVANLVHDLRTPLVSIRGYTKMILEERAGSINSTQREYLNIVSENTQRLVEMLNRLMQASASQTLHFDTLDLPALWQDALLAIRPRAQERSIMVRERIPSEPLLILGDRQKLTEVFSHLLSNAVKFSDPGGEVELEISRQDGEARMTVSDKGVSIPAELLENVLSGGDDFGRPVSARDSFGVGIALLRDLIRLHGGRAGVFNKTGGGVTFLITLPTVLLEAVA